MTLANIKFTDTSSMLCKIMACAAIFSIWLPTAVPNVFLFFFLIFWLFSGNYKITYDLAKNNQIAIISICLFLLFCAGLMYTTASWDDSSDILKKYAKLAYIPLLMYAFHEKKWKNYGYISLMAGITLMLLMSYLHMLGILEPEDIYVGSYAGQTDFVVFRSRIAHSMLVAFGVYMYVKHAIEIPKYRTLLISLAVLGVCNILFMVTARTGIAVLFVLILHLCFTCLDWKKMILVCVATFLLIGSSVFVDFFGFSRLNETISEVKKYQQGNYRTSMGVRLFFIEGGWAILKDNPVFGKGTGSFKTEIKKYIKEKSIIHEGSYVTNNPHNGYVSVASQIGFLGLAILLWLGVQQWLTSNCLEPVYRDAAKAALITSAVGNLFNSVLMNHTQGIFFILLTALLFSSIQNQKDV